MRVETPSVLLIYTGGTIGMIENPETGALENFNFDHLLKHVPELKRFNYRISSYQFDPPLDSSDMEPAYWAKLVKIINYNYDYFDGFVILHGTDTMAYTASALSFMLENLSKPVILTGSQLPIGTLRTDGKENLITAIEIAAAKNPDGPGAEYAATRHNAGAWFVDLLAERLRAPLREEAKFFGYTSRVTLGGEDVRLLVPTTFMNLSGKAVAAMASFFRINPDEILVAHDELDLPPGVAKFKLGGGHGGHNGLKDIISKLGNNPNFHRLRIGIGHPGDKDKVVGFVLGKPPVSEQKLIDEAIDEAARCTEMWFTDGLTKATNRLHAFKAQ